MLHTILYFLVGLTVCSAALDAKPSLKGRMTTTATKNELRSVKQLTLELSTYPKSPENEDPNVVEAIDAWKEKQQIAIDKVTAHEKLNAAK